jgi:hypothetical protein
MCETTYCVTVWLPDSPIIIALIVVITGLGVWKIVKSIVDTIPVVG